MTGNLPAACNSFLSADLPLLGQKEISPSLSVSDLELQMLVSHGRAQDEPRAGTLNGYGAKGTLMIGTQ